MTVIDQHVRSHGRHLDETVTRNNLEAAEDAPATCADNGGIAIIDCRHGAFPELSTRPVLRRLVECLGRDRTRHQLRSPRWGSVQMTRKREKASSEAFSSPCEASQIVVHRRPVEPGADSSSKGFVGKGLRRGRVPRTHRGWGLSTERAKEASARSPPLPRDDDAAWAPAWPRRPLRHARSSDAFLDHRRRAGGARDRRVEGVDAPVQEATKRPVSALSGRGNTRARSSVHRSSSDPVKLAEQAPRSTPSTRASELRRRRPRPGVALSQGTAPAGSLPRLPARRILWVHLAPQRPRAARRGRLRERVRHSARAGRRRRAR